jgi:hypothetical protein
VFSLIRQKSEIFGDTATTAATIASSNDAETIEKAVARFWQLYGGPLLLIEGSAVESEMVGIEEILEKHDSRLSNLTLEERSTLKRRALALGRACRSEMTQIAKELDEELRKAEG